jgi:hypothetical protein
MNRPHVRVHPTGVGFGGPCLAIEPVQVGAAGQGGPRRTGSA